MGFVKRIVLFLAINFLVVITVSLILNLLHVQPYLQHYGLNLKSLAIFCLVWGMAGSLISLALSRQMAKWMVGVRLIDPKSGDAEQMELLSVVARLARKANLPQTPEVGIFTSAEPNAFATGPTKRRSLVAVSTGLMQRMSPQELEGVLAHEIAHIANGDMVTMTLLQGVVNAFVMFLARVCAFALSSFGKNRNESPSYMSYTLFVILFEVVFMVLGSLVICAFSRWREFRADRGGASLAGKPSMIGALESLLRLQSIQDPKMEKGAIAAFKISVKKPKNRVLRLFSTHPPLEERISCLKRS